ncbi:MAG: DUF4911 domain-containing protein [Candidatus Saccharibacteria bacterium]
MNDKNEIRCRLNPADIDKLNRIFEGLDGIGIVSTTDRKLGLVVVRVTPDTYPDALKVIENAPFPVELAADQYDGFPVDRGLA